MDTKIVDAGNLMIDKDTYLCNIDVDIKGMIMLIIVNLTIKTEKVETIYKLCSVNKTLQHLLCDNIYFWELLYTKNIADKIPNPKKLKIITENRYEMMKEKIKNQPENKHFILYIQMLEKLLIILNNKLNAKITQKEYIENLYQFAVSILDYKWATTLSYASNFGFNILKDNLIKSSSYLREYKNSNNPYINESDLPIMAGQNIMLIYDLFKKNKLEHIHQIIKNGYDINKFYFTELGDISSSNEMKNTLGMEINTLGMAILIGDSRLVEYLLNLGANTDIVLKNLDNPSEKYSAYQYTKLFINSNRKPIFFYNHDEILKIISKEQKLRQKEKQKGISKTYLDTLFSFFNCSN